MMLPGFLPASSRDVPPSVCQRIADSLLNLFFPESCILCSTPTSRRQERSICSKCWQKTMQLRITGSCCPLCGLPYRSFEQESTHLCGKCTLRLPPFSGARAFGYYSFELSRVIQALKFDGRQDLAALFAPLLASTFLESWSSQEIDLIVPVPLHPKRKRERGYNQAALLGRALGNLLGLPFDDRTMSRVRPTLPQVGLSDTERSHNVRHAFRCVRHDAVRGRRILLIDDVMTTGSTVASATEALVEAGALRVCVLTLARAVAGGE